MSDAELSPTIAEALGVSSPTREALADRLAEIGGLCQPTRMESTELLVATLQHAVRQIPSVPAAWSWGEFEHAGMYPVHQLVEADDRDRLTVCARDLGLADRGSSRPFDTAPEALSRSLTEAIQQLLRSLRARLEAAGISTHGHRGLR
jgi:hypothetical protein